jgi:hypothetical protein
MSADLSILQAALIGYQHQRDQIEAKMAEIRSQLGGKGAAVKPMVTTATGAPVKRALSPSARKRIAAGQRKRWAAFNAAKQSAPKKRKMSAAGRERIAEATRKRWAEFRAKKAAAK